MKGYFSGRALADARVAASLTQRQYADKLGISLRTIEDYERDIFVPSADRLFVLAQVLRVKLEVLFSKKRPTRRPRKGYRAKS